MAHKKWGVLLINLGTPTEPTPKAVGKYLIEFLLDPEVIVLPWFLRQILVRFIITPFRKKKSAKLYQLIWTDQGSPLFILTRSIAREVQKLLPQMVVDYAFRYGEPSIPQILQKMQDQGVTDLLILPLYPQYATSSTRTVATLLKELKVSDRFQNVRWYPSFHNEAFYIQSEANLIHRRRLPGSFVLFSFHSIPVAHIKDNHKGCDECLKKTVCHYEGDSMCYRRQCFETATAIAKEMKLQDSEWSVSFQSRLGRAEWLTPNTAFELPRLGKEKQRLTVVAPGFIADCLETLEELDRQGREQFLEGGGKEWVRVPCLNADHEWIRNLSTWLEKQTSEEKNGKTPSQPSL